MCINVFLCEVWCYCVNGIFSVYDLEKGIKYMQHKRQNLVKGACMLNTDIKNKNKTTSVLKEDFFPNFV